MSMIKIQNSANEISQLKQNSLIFNPIEMTIQAYDYIDKSRSFEREIESIKNDLIRSELNTVAKIDSNHEHLCIVQDIVDSLPQLPNFQQQKLVIPEFGEIEVEPSDSAEIKKFIRKVNYEFLGYHCNHSTADKNCDLVFKHATDLYSSKEYKNYVNFLKDLAHIVWSIRNEDKCDRKWDEYSLLPTGNEVSKIIDSLINLAGNIEKYNAVMNPTCSKCKAAVRKYNYSVKEIQRMRNELSEQMKINEEFIDKPIEEKYSINDFLSKNYPTADRFLLSDVKEKFKATFKLTKTFDQLISLIESTGKFKITRSKNVYYVNRL